MLAKGHSACEVHQKKVEEGFPPIEPTDFPQALQGEGEEREAEGLYQGIGKDMCNRQEKLHRSTS